MKGCIRSMKDDISVYEARFVVVDVETTGLDPQKDRICEIAFIEMKGFKEIDRFSTLLNPTIPIPFNVSSIHGIYDEDVLKAPSFADIADILLSKLSDAVVVGHNIQFDLGFIKNEFIRVGLNIPDVMLVDTLVLSKRYLSNLSNNKLKTVAESINLHSQNWHRALNDVEITKEVFIYLLRLLVNEYEVKSIGDLVRLAS